jgi:hypothetical protein
MEPTIIPIFGMITGIIINVALFTAIVLAIYYNVRARNKERMALIERGVDISEIYKVKKTKSYGFLKFGMVMVGCAVGLVFAALLSKSDAMPPVVAYFAMILLFAGISVVGTNYWIAKKQTTTES